jgi:hypothetical protein
MNIKGAPSTVDVPGGSGSIFGAAKINISAPKARSRNTSKRSAMETRSRVWSAATEFRISDSLPPRGRALAGTERIAWENPSSADIEVRTA